MSDTIKGISQVRCPARKMWDTFRPLNLTPAWQAVDNPSYAYSWNEDKVDVATNGSGPAEQVVTGPSA